MFQIPRKRSRSIPLRSSRSTEEGTPPSPPQNVTKEERQALQELAKDTSVVVLPADKGKATVVMDTEGHKFKMQEMLAEIERTRH